MSDYLTTLALRAVSPPQSIRPRPAAHFESPTAVDRPPVESSPAPAASRVGPVSPERSLAGRSTPTSGAEEKVGAADRIAESPSQKRAVSRRGQQQEEPSTVREAHVDDAHGGAPHRGHAVDPGPPSDSAGSTPERVDHRAIAVPAPEAEPAQAIERAVPSAQPSDDHAGADAVKGLDDPVVDANEDPVREIATTAFTPTLRSPSRSRLRRARAERDDGPHITVTIGRVEVTSPDQQPPPAEEGIQRPALGLADYLKDRSRS